MVKEILRNKDENKMKVHNDIWNFVMYLKCITFHDFFKNKFNYYLRNY